MSIKIKLASNLAVLAISATNFKDDGSTDDSGVSLRDAADMSGFAFVDDFYRLTDLGAMKCCI